MVVGGRGEEGDGGGGMGGPTCEDEKCFVETLSGKKYVAFENVPPTFGFFHGMLQFTVCNLSVTLTED